MTDDWTWYIWAAVGTLVSVISVAVWSWLKDRRKRRNECELLKGRFGKQVAKVEACYRKTSDGEKKKKPAESLFSGWCPVRGVGGGDDANSDNDELDTTYPEEDIDALNDAIKTYGQGDIKSSLDGMSKLDSLAKELEVDESAYTIGELGELHGKLMTADLRIKAKKYEAELTEEQRKKEAEIRQQQLESIFMLMQQQQEKFGSQNEGDIVEQMKLYAL